MKKILVTSFAVLCGFLFVGLAGAALVTNGVFGTQTNDSALTGYVGEVQIASASSAQATTLAAASAVKITSVTLGSGDWQVSGQCDQSLASASAVATVLCGLTQTLGTAPTIAGSGVVPADAATSSMVAVAPASAVVSNSFGPVRITLPASAVIYLEDTVTSPNGTGAGVVYGSVTARRAR